MFFYFKRRFFDDFAKIGFLLVPLRLFMGIGWVRAGVEKFLDPKWSSGETLIKFLNANETFSPIYNVLIDNLFIPQAAIFANLVSFGQFLVGVSIFTGTLTNISLLIAIFMNLNFILMEKTLPSAFYIIIQVELLLMDTGALLGVDSLLNKKIPFSFLTARPFKYGKNLSLEKKYFFVGMILFFLLSFLGISEVKHLSPHAVHDPEMIFFVMCTYASFGYALQIYRFRRGIRKEFRSLSIISENDKTYDVLTLDLSHEGVSFLIPSSLKDDITRVEKYEIDLFDRISRKVIKLDGKIKYAINYGPIGGENYTRVGFIFSNLPLARELTSKIMDSNIERIVNNSMLSGREDETKKAS